VRIKVEKTKTTKLHWPKKYWNNKIRNEARCFWLMPVILAPQEVEIRRITV
jgi:hypothetical protein